MSRSPAQALDATAQLGLVPGAGRTTPLKPRVISNYPDPSWWVRLPAPTPRGYRWEHAETWQAGLDLALAGVTR